MTATPMTLTLPDGKPLTGTYEHDLAQGRTLYRLDRIGTFSVRWSDHQLLRRDQDGPDVHLCYGLDVHGADGTTAPATRFLEGGPPAEAPQMNSVQLGGCAAFPPAAMRPRTRDAEGWPLDRWCNVRRPNGAGVPDRTHGRVAMIVYTIVTHWLALPVHDDLRAARARLLAPGRLAAYRATLDKLDRDLAGLQADRAKVAAAIEGQRLLLTPIDVDW